ncbi:MAG: AAA family ATPase, partial [Propionivibrio sp.]
MYLDHFGLREAPFRITPHTEFFFAGARRGATLDALIYAITRDEGIVKVSGEVGSGKTMLCRMLLEKLPADVETVYLANPSLSRHEILHAIAAELHAPLPEKQTQLLQKSLQDRLLAIHASGRLVVMLIDEAHAMPPETLEEIRLLSNLETNRHKLLHIVLFGQPELEQRLGESSMRQLKERITHNFELEPLRRDDIGDYLMFRMRAAGYHGPDLFTAGALQLISRASEGLTRRINILADKALLAAYAGNTHQIDRPQIKAAIHDAQFKPMHERRTDRRAWILGGGAIALLVLVAAIVYLTGNRQFGGDRLVTVPKTGAAVAAAASPVVAAAPAPPAITMAA